MRCVLLWPECVSREGCSDGGLSDKEKGASVLQVGYAIHCIGTGSVVLQGMWPKVCL